MKDTQYISEYKRLIREKAVKAFCHATCPNGMRCKNTSTQYSCKRARRFMNELDAQLRENNDQGPTNV